MKTVKVFALLLVMSILPLALPVGAQIQATSVEIRGTVAAVNAAPGGINLTNMPPSISWSSQSFAGFYYDSKDNLGTENLNIDTAVNDGGGTFTADSRRIPKSAMTYSTTGQPKLLQVVDQKFSPNGTPDITAATNAGLEQTGPSKGFEGGNYMILGWQAQPYVALNGKVDHLSQLILEQGTSAQDKKTLQVGETWDVGGGWTITANSIDAKATPRQVWLTLSLNGVKKDDKVITQGGIYTYTEKSLSDQSDVPVFLTYVDSVFAGATSDMVQLRYTWAISESVTKISSSDTYGVFKNANVEGNTLTLKNDDSSVSLTRDSTQDLMGNMKLLVADNDTLRFYPMVIRDQPGTYEVRGTVASVNALPGGINITEMPESITWSPQSFAGFYYDLKDDLGSENLNIDTTANDGGGTFTADSRRIPKSAMTYSTTGQPKLLQVVDQKFNANGTVDITGATNAGLEQTGAGKGLQSGYYMVLGWQAQPYVALNSKVDHLSQLILEQGTSAQEKKTLQVGETWDIGGGWTLTANSIDAKATPRQVWLTLSLNGVKKDDKVVTQGGIYTFTEKSLSDQSDVPVFLTYIDSVFSGATSDMVQLRYTWAISESVTKISSSDTYGVFKNANVEGNTLTLKNDDNSISLTRDSTQDLMGNMKFLVADNDTLRFYPKVDYSISGANVTPTSTAGGNAAITATVAVTSTAVSTETPSGTAPSAVETTAGEVATPAGSSGPSATPTKSPGFEAIIAIVGLIVVAVLILRNKK